MPFLTGLIRNYIKLGWLSYIQFVAVASQY